MFFFYLQHKQSHKTALVLPTFDLFDSNLPRNSTFGVILCAITPAPSAANTRLSAFAYQTQSEHITTVLNNLDSKKYLHNVEPTAQNRDRCHEDAHERL